MLFQTVFTPGTSGENVVAQAINITEKVAGSTNGFLKKIAWVESRFGEHPSTYRAGYHGGIFQVDYVGFKDTQDVASHPGLKAKLDFLKTRGCHWMKMSWIDLRKPAYSAMAARLLLSNIPEAIPTSLEGQAKYWKKYYNTGSGKGSAEEFMERWNDYIRNKGR